MGKNMKKQAYEAYIIMRNKIPDTTSEELEDAVRKYLMRKKMRRVGMYFGIALIAYFLRNHGMSLFPNFDSDTLKPGGIDILGATEAICCIIGAMSLSKGLHEPLTPDQIREYEEREHLEKTGKPYEK